MPKITFNVPLNNKLSNKLTYTIYKSLLQLTVMGVFHIHDFLLSQT